MIRIVVVEDYALIREGLCVLLERVDGLEIVGLAEDGGECLCVVPSVKPDVVVLDYGLPDMDGLTVIKELRRLSTARILVVSQNAHPHFVARAIEAGAHGFAPKTVAVDELVEGIRRVHAKETYIEGGLAARVVQALHGPLGRKPLEQALSAREFEVVRHIASGRGMAEAAEAMKISASAASTYRTRAMRKLDVHNTSSLVKAAIQLGIVEN